VRAGLTDGDGDDLFHEPFLWKVRGRSSKISKISRLAVVRTVPGTLFDTSRFQNRRALGLRRQEGTTLAGHGPVGEPRPCCCETVAFLVLLPLYSATLIAVKRARIRTPAFNVATGSSPCCSAVLSPFGAGYYILV
jgi:hypothetical protein